MARRCVKATNFHSTTSRAFGVDLIVRERPTAGTSVPYFVANLIGSLRKHRDNVQDAIRLLSTQP